MTGEPDGYHIIDEATAFRRAETLQFGPVIDIARDVAQGLDRPLRILDCGCGGGQIGAMLTASNVQCDYTGVDINLGNLIAGNRYYTDSRFVVADIHKLPFEDDTFDMAIALGVLFLLPDAGIAVAEMKRVARTVSADIITAQQGSNSLRMRSAYGGWMHIPNSAHNHEILTMAGLPDPHLVLHWEVSTHDSKGYYAYQGISSRLQSLYVWRF